MRLNHGLTDLEELTATLRGFEKQKLPQADIKEAFDLVCSKLFGCTRDDLIAPLSRTLIEEIKEYDYDLVVMIAEQHGCDIKSRKYQDFVLLPIDFDDEDDEDVDDWVVQRADYRPPEKQDEPAYAPVIKHWRELVEMMLAKEEGLFPSTPEQVREVRERQAAKRFAEKRARERSRDSNTQAELRAVFGTSQAIKPGVTTATNRSRPGVGREVKVEVINRRRPKP